MSQKSVKTAAELESMITAELREHPECESAGVEVIKPTGVGRRTNRRWAATQCRVQREARRNHHSASPGVRFG